MSWRRPGSTLVRLAGSLALAGAVAGAAALAQAPAAGGGASAPFDLAAGDMGGRLEFATSDARNRQGSAWNLISTTTQPGWASGPPTFPQDLVFSFFSRQPALVAAVEVNPTSRFQGGAVKDVEIWTSAESATDGFTRVAAATLRNEDALQAVPFEPVEAKYVRVRVLSSYSPNTFWPVVASRVRILEGARPGYESLVQRNAALAALLKSGFQPAPAAATLPLPATEGSAVCPAPPPPKPSRFPKSQQVLLIVDDVATYKGVSADPWGPAPLAKTTVGATITAIPPEAAVPARLLSQPEVDTVVFSQVCDMETSVSAAFKQALLSWVAAGHKVIFQDSDACTLDDRQPGAKGNMNRVPDYGFLPYPMRTSNPGPSGSSGLNGVLENTTLVSANRRDPSFIDTADWMKSNNDLGDTSVMLEYDGRWCGAMWAKNRLHKNGVALAYAHYGRGLLIYDGFDFQQWSNPQHAKLQRQELLQPFDPDYLPCSQPLGDFVVTTDAGLKTQYAEPGKTYTYPLSVLGTLSYEGTVALDATVQPRDPGITATLASATADLTTADEASTTLTVTMTAAAAPNGRVVAVRGRDATGTTNVVCLNLPERKTGSLTILSGLHKDRKPTKNLEIILDASGSMKALIGKKTRWATAQDVLADVVSKLPDDYHVGLRAYGHREPSTSPRACTDTELVVPVGPLDRQALLAAAGRLKPRGETPLVYSTLQTPGDLKAAGGGTVILITDGEESCKGDLAAAATTLQESGLEVTLNIVGFALKAPVVQKQLGALAGSTGGRFFSAQSGAALARALMLAAVDQLPYRVLDGKGSEVAKGVAGVDGAHELPPGDYTVIVNAGEESLTVPVTMAVRQDQRVTIVVKGDQLAVER